MKTNKIFIILLISLLAIIMGTTTAGATSVYDGFSDLNAWSQEHWVPGVGYQATTTGTVSGGVLTVADNNDEYHLIHTTAQYAKPFTVSYDIWPVSGTQMILRFTGTLSFVEYTMIVNGNQQTFNGVTVAGNIPAGEWTHVKINVYANNTVEVYNNGVKKITSTYGSIGTPTAFSFREQLAHFKLKNFYMSDVVESDYVPEVDVTFNGYVKNANGDPLQYANVTLWDYSVPLNSDLTDANGYYEFVETITTGHAGYIQSVWPANEGGYTNAEVYGANTSINPFTKNFTAAPVKLQVYVYDGNYGVNTEIDAFDIVVNKNNGAEILSYSGKDSGWIFPGTLNVSDNIVLTVSKTGYMNGTDTINPIEAGWNFGQVPLYQEFSGGNFVRISGYTRDQEGVKIPGLEMWLEDAATNAIIYHTVSGSFDGYYSICVPTAYNPKTYKVVINYPGHGNLTTSLKKASTMLNFGTGSTFTYPTDFTGVDPTNEGVDLLLALAYVPTPTATPSGNPPPARPGRAHRDASP
jgi:hypothetical protein